MDHRRTRAFPVLAACLLLSGPPQCPGQSTASQARQPISPETTTTYESDPSLAVNVDSVLRLAQGAVDLRIRCLPEAESSGRAFARRLSLYLPAVERALGVPLDPPRGRIVVHGKGGIMAGYENINSSMARDYLGRENAALLFHEVGHLWFGAYAGAGRWMDEGVVSFLPLALREGGLLALSDEDRIQIEDNWGLHGTETRLDLPLASLTRPPAYTDEWEALYVRSFKIQYLLFRELGGCGPYLAFLRLLLENRTSDDAAVLAALDRIKPMDWRGFLSGWAFPGPYGPFPPAAFGDDDGDGLMNVDEAYAGTAARRADSDGDGYADGWERARAFSPLDPASRPALGDMAVDGVPDEPAAAPVLGRAKTRPTATGQSALADLKLWLDERTVWLRASFARQDRLPVHNTVRLRDPGGRNFWIQSIDCRQVWVAEFRDGEPFGSWRTVVVPAEAAVLARADVFECRLDLAAFGTAGDFEVWYITGDARGGEDAWNSDWIRSGMVARPARPIRLDGDLSDFLGKADPVRLDIPATSAGTAVLDFGLRTLWAGQDGERLYVAAQTRFPSEAGPGAYVTLHLRDPLAGRNWWIQSFEGGQPGCRTFDDGEAVGEWRSLDDPALLADLRLGMGPDLLIAVPWRLIEAARPARLEIRMLASGRRGADAVWDAETTPWLKYYPIPPVVAVTGRNLEAFRALVSARAAQAAPASGTPPLDFDLSWFSGGVRDGVLYLSAESRRPITARPGSIITCHVMLAEQKLNYWIQKEDGWMGVSRFADGTPFGSWTGIKDRPAVRAIEIAVADELEIAIPLDAIPEAAAAKTVRVRLILSSLVDGAIRWDAVQSQVLEVPVGR